MVETETNTNESKFSFIGGHLSLDFTNTISEYRPTPREDKFIDYSDLVTWGKEAGVLTSEQAQKLLHEAERRPGEAGNALKQAQALRNAIHFIFAARSDGSVPEVGDLTTLNAALAAAMCHAQIAPSGDGKGFAWDWTYDGDELDRMLWPVARSAAELLTSNELDRVHECAGANCGWLFLDMSRNHSRHWCDMRDCGNRAKVRRYYQRKREA